MAREIVFRSWAVSFAPPPLHALCLAMLGRFYRLDGSWAWGDRLGLDSAPAAVVSFQCVLGLGQAFWVWPKCWASPKLTNHNPEPNLLLFRRWARGRLNLTIGGLDLSVLPAFLLLSFATNAVASLGAEVREYPDLEPTHEVLVPDLWTWFCRFYPLNFWTAWLQIHRFPTPPPLEFKVDRFSNLSNFGLSIYF